MNKFKNINIWAVKWLHGPLIVLTFALVVGVPLAYLLYTASLGVSHFILGLVYLGAMFSWFMAAMGGWDRDRAQTTFILFGLVCILEAVFFSPLIALVLALFPVIVWFTDTRVELRQQRAWKNIKLVCETFQVELDNQYLQGKARPDFLGSSEYGICVEVLANSQGQLPTEFMGYPVSQKVVS